MSGHWSDCAVYNEPASPAGPCDCGGFSAMTDAQAKRALGVGQSTLSAKQRTHCDPFESPQPIVTDNPALPLNQALPAPWPDAAAWPVTGGKFAQTVTRYKINPMVMGDDLPHAEPKKPIDIMSITRGMCK